jgi:hypothetical protein
MAVLTITTDFPLLQPILNNDVPAGVSFISPPPTFHRSLDVHVTVNVDVRIAIDLGVITAAAAASWLVHRLRAIRGDFPDYGVRLEAKQLPPDDADAIKLITGTIQDDEGGQ